MVVTISPKNYIVFHDGSDDHWNHEVERAGIADRTDLCVVAEEKVEPGLHWTVLASREDK